MVDLYGFYLHCVKFSITSGKLLLQEQFVLYDSLISSLVRFHSSIYL